MSTNKTIYLIRHGETDFNRMGIIQGSGVNSSLNDKGVQQAQQFHEAYKHIPFQKIYTSELTRTHQSVEPFIRNGHQQTVHPGLNEINWGIFEGVQSNPALHARYEEIVQSWRNGDLELCIEGGESPLQMQRRQKEAWQQILNDPCEGAILVCMHGRAMRSFLSLVLETPLSQMDDYGHSNLCLYVIEVKNGKTLLAKTNNIEHLEQTVTPS